MNKEVDVYIGDTCVRGSCIFEDGRYIVEYSNNVSDEGDVVFYRLVVDAEGFMIYQDGAIKTCMIYKADGLTYDFTYRTSFGSIDMQLRTNQLRIDIAEGAIHVEAEYALCQAGGDVASNLVMIDVKNCSK